MRLALTWYLFGLLLVGWGLTLARELHWLPAAAFDLQRILGYAVLGAVPFFVLALTVALWPARNDPAEAGAWTPADGRDHQAAD